MSEATGVRLFSDLDRTLVPNGSEPESALARPLLRELAAEGALSLVYVSGRHLALIEEAIATYGLPAPDLVVGDVGASIYERRAGGEWQRLAEWTAQIAPDWHGHKSGDLALLFADIDELEPQEAFRQGPFKLSYYLAAEKDPVELLAEMNRRVAALGIRAELTFSVDDERGVGLLDVLPPRATKLGALRFLAGRAGLPQDRVVFAGDSGNDLPVLTSGVCAVLVRNARPEVREAARRQLELRGGRESLYVARGDFLGMNGNYTAGALEGLAHFRPELRARMEGARDRMRMR